MIAAAFSARGRLATGVEARVMGVPEDGSAAAAEDKGAGDRAKGGPGLVEVRGLVKRFGGFVAVNGVSFSIAEGTCFGLLGPNGAGKTTTIEMIEDIISPTEGEIYYRQRPRASRFREEVGIQFQSTELLAFMTVAETLETFRHLYRDALDPEGLLERCRLTEVKDSYTDRMSGGRSSASTWPWP